MLTPPQSSRKIKVVQRLVQRSNQTSLWSLPRPRHWNIACITREGIVGGLMAPLKGLHVLQARGCG